jgi:hypothetical protein
MKLLDLLTHYAKQLNEERENVMLHGLDAPFEIPRARHLRTVGSLHLYAVELPEGKSLVPDVPITFLPASDLDPTEGYVFGHSGGETLILTTDAFGQTVEHCTLIPDTLGYLETASHRLSEMASKPESFTLGPSERLVPWLDPDPSTADPRARDTISATVLTTVWGEEQAGRWTKLGPLLVEQIRKNKRILMLAPDHGATDKVTSLMARTLRNAALPIKSLLSRYELPVSEEIGGVVLKELSFENHMHQFYAKANANKTALRKKYDRFRELAPILAYKRDRQKDLNEVKLLEWRLLTEVSEYQAKIKNIDTLVAEYEAIPIWKRLAMQTAGKNVKTLGEYRGLYEQKLQALMKEVEIAQHRIRELTPEATVPKDMRPEFDELKEEISRLGGTKKIREILSAGEGTNRQAFIQNKRIVASTPERIILDSVFQRVRFDVLVIDDAPKIPAPLILAAAGITRERIILSGDTQDLLPLQSEDSRMGLGQWKQHCLPAQLGSEPQPSIVG